MNLSNEKELVKKAQKEPEAFAKLYDKYYSQIFGYILKRVADLEVAQDITSETFFKALKNLWKFRWRNTPFSVYPVGHRRCSFGAWLYRIANNEIANYFRKNKRYSVSLDEVLEKDFYSASKFLVQGEPVALHNPETEFIEAQEELKKYQDFLEIQEKISQLPIKYQEVITLRFFEKKKIKEIAEILGKKEGTIKSLLHRGLEKLKNLIE